jgi:hypothetical protein
MNAPPSRLHANVLLGLVAVKLKIAVLLFVRAPGVDVRMVSGGVEFVV